MLWTIFVILLIMWLLGFSFHIAGSLVHLLLVVALIVLIVNLISGGVRKSMTASRATKTRLTNPTLASECAFSQFLISGLPVSGSNIRVTLYHSPRRVILNPCLTVA